MLRVETKHELERDPCAEEREYEYEQGKGQELGQDWHRACATSID